MHNSGFIMSSMADPFNSIISHSEMIELNGLMKKQSSQYLDMCYIAVQESFNYSSPPQSPKRREISSKKMVWKMSIV